MDQPEGEKEQMANQPQVRVLVVDDDPEVGQDLRAILEPRGYRVQVTQGTGQSLMDQTVGLARSFRPHVAIIDVRLLEHTDDRSGLQLLGPLQSSWCILYSAHLTAEVTRDAFNLYRNVSWVSKAEPPQLLLETIADAARRTCATRANLSIRPTRRSQQIIRILFGQVTDVPPESIDDVLSRLFPKNRFLALQTVAGEVETSLHASRGHSVVLKVQRDGFEPTIVKLAPAERIQGEDKNYREHVKDRLVGRFYAQLEGVAEFWDVGGAVYTFLGSSLRNLPSFTDFYRKERNPKNVLKPLRYFFTEVWKRHYDRPRIRKRQTLFQIYNRALRLEKRLKEFHNQEDKISIPGLSISLANPVSWVLRHATESHVANMRLAVTHGDLHGDNLFVDGMYAWAIDFERTGPGHILRDFVELEVDIITRLVCVDDISRFFELALVLAEPLEPRSLFKPSRRLSADPETAKALEIIAGLRAIAYEATRYSDSQEYLWGLLLDALFVATLGPAETVQQSRSLLLAAVLCERLQRWNKDWPPKGWLPERTRNDSRVSKERSHKQTEPTKLREALTTRFNKSELKDLCTELSVDYDSLPGEGKTDKARELVAYLSRRRRLVDLVRAIKRSRPDITL